MNSILYVASYALFQQNVPTTTHLMPQSASCATAYTPILQHALYTYTQRSLSPSDVPGTCPYLTWNMSPSHVPRTCPHLTSPEHVPISRARNMSPSDVPGTCPLACALYYINFYHGFAQVMVNKRLVVA